MFTRSSGLFHASNLSPNRKNHVEECNTGWRNDPCAVRNNVVCADLRLSLILWPAAMIVPYRRRLRLVIGFVAPFKWPFLFRQCASDADARHEMREGHAGACRDRNISAFNVANALGGLIGGAIVDSSFGASAIPFAAPSYLSRAPLHPVAGAPRAAAGDTANTIARRDVLS